MDKNKIRTFEMMHIRIHVAYSMPEELNVNGIDLSDEAKGKEGMVIVLENRKKELQEILIWFNPICGNVYIETLAHETWHLFFRLLEILSNNVEQFSLEELGKEVYAYRFEELYSNIAKRIRELIELNGKKPEKELTHYHRTTTTGYTMARYRLNG